MLGESLALAAALTWSVSVILFKRSEAISPQGMNLFKNLVAVGCLLVTALVLGIALDVDRPPEDWWSLVASGVLGIAVADTMIFMALRRLGAGLLAIVDCAYAPTIVLLSILFLDEQVGPGFLVGAACVIGGVLLATGRAEPAAGHERADIAAGVLLGVGGVAAMAVGVILAKGPLESGDLVEVSLVRLVAGVGGQLVWIAAAPSQRTAFAALRPSPAWRTLLPAAVLGSYVAMLFWLGGFKWADASTASVLNQMASVFTLLLARVFLGEPLTPRRLAGAALAVGGAVAILQL